MAGIGLGDVGHQADGKVTRIISSGEVITFVVGADDTVARRNVVLGQRDGIYWVVDSGLEEGDRVIVNGIQKVRSGMPVTASPVAALPDADADR